MTWPSATGRKLLVAEAWETLVQGLQALPSQIEFRNPSRMPQGAVSAAACRAAGVSRSTLWARLNPDRVDAVQRAEAARQWRERMRVEWLAYCAAYRSTWPDRGAPIGFGRWLADGWYRAWRASSDAVLSAPNVRTLRSARNALESAMHPGGDRGGSPK